MILLYTRKSQEMELSATRSEFRTLSSLLRAGRGLQQCQVAVSDPSPDEVYGEQIFVEAVPNGKVAVHLDLNGNRLKNSGEYRWLDILAKNFEGLADAASVGNHLHIEYFDDHFYLAEGSMPLVCRLIGTK